MNDTAATDTALDALERARRAWEKRQDQQQLDLDPDAGLDETHTDTTSTPPPGGRVRLVEPDLHGFGGQSDAGTVGESSPPLTSQGSSFRQDTIESADSRVPGPRHLHVAPDPTVPTPIPLPRLLEVLS